MKKIILKSAIITVIFVTTITGISATSVTFSEPVPTAQATNHLPEKPKSEITDYGYVKLTRLDPDAVTFSVKGPGASSYGPGTTVYKTGTNYKVKYQEEYGIGTKMTARFRNHNWSMNSNMISGTFDYK